MPPPPCGNTRHPTAPSPTNSHRRKTASSSPSPAPTDNRPDPESSPTRNPTGTTASPSPLPAPTRSSNTSAAAHHPPRPSPTRTPPNTPAAPDATAPPPTPPAHTPAHHQHADAVHLQPRHTGTPPSTAHQYHPPDRTTNHHHHQPASPTRNHHPSDNRTPLGLLRQSRPSRQSSQYHSVSFSQKPSPNRAALGRPRSLEHPTSNSPHFFEGPNALYPAAIPQSSCDRLSRRQQAYIRFEGDQSTHKLYSTDHN